MQFYRDKEEVDDPWEDDLNAQDVNDDGGQAGQGGPVLMVGGESQLMLYFGAMLLNLRGNYLRKQKCTGGSLNSLV